MNIGLIDVDGHNFPNLPLMKISAYHKSIGDTVEWINLFEHYDKVYMSKVFTFTPDFEYCINADEIVQGGTGYGLDNKLPAEIESIYPDYSLYPEFNEAYGFLTRGCPRNCEFCIVGKKEGLCSYKVADLDQFWNGQKTIKLLDPNLLACKEHMGLLQQLIDSRAKIDVTQGFDIRLVTHKNIELIKRMKIGCIHFAWDNPKDDLLDKFKYVQAELNLPIRKLKAYVLTNFDTTFEEDLYRVYALRDIGVDPYVMIYEKDTAPQQIRYLQQWCNNKIIFRSEADFYKYNPKKSIVYKHQ